MLWKLPNAPQAAEATHCDPTPVSPDTQAVSVLALMNSRGERHFRPLCGVKGVLGTIRWIVSALNGQRPGVFVIVLDPVSYQCQNGFRIGQRVDADVAALERPHEWRDPVRHWSEDNGRATCRWIAGRLPARSRASGPAGGRRCGFPSPYRRCHCRSAPRPVPARGRCRSASRRPPAAYLAGPGH